MNIKNLVKVNKEDFYKIIYFFKLDVHPNCITWQNLQWQTRGFHTFGRSVQILPEGQNWPYVEEFYVTPYWESRIKEIPESFTC